MQKRKTTKESTLPILLLTLLSFLVIFLVLALPGVGIAFLCGIRSPQALINSGIYSFMAITLIIVIIVKIKDFIEERSFFDKKK